MEPHRHHIPQALTRGLLRSTDTGCQHLGIHCVRGKDRLSFATRLRERVLVPECFGLPAFPQMKCHPQSSQEIIPMSFPDLHRTESRIPSAPLAGSGLCLDIFYYHV
jgi:hypothetical protein